MSNCKDFAEVVLTADRFYPLCKPSRALLSASRAILLSRDSECCAPAFSPKKRWRLSYTSLDGRKDIFLTGDRSMPKGLAMVQMHAAEADLVPVEGGVYSQTESGVSSSAFTEAQSEVQTDTEVISGGKQERAQATLRGAGNIEKGQATLRAAGIFPGGYRRPEVRLPGLVLMVTAGDVFGPDAKESLEKLDLAVAGGLTMVVLGGAEGDTGARVYEAACVLKSILRGRAGLLVAERVDIAAASGASGVLLSDEGLPAVVARSMMQNVSSENSVLPLVARSVASAQSALTATASEGADLLILQVPQDADVSTLVRSVCEGVSIPVFLRLSNIRLQSVFTPESIFSSAVKAGGNGLVFDGVELRNLEMDSINSLVSSLISSMESMGRSLSEPDMSLPSPGLNEPVQNISEVGELMSLDTQAKLILDEERVLLTSLIELVHEASPEMEEISLLEDAVAQLDEPFLLMIVGEFNSGKSSVINALLGKRYLNEGVLPTTNEIALLRHASSGIDGKERSERHPDGHFMHYLSAELLKQINLVDTPGTNVILKRQQRLTEEFVPRADLVLFVLSADRPFTESEMTFLRYIRQWDKKIIFLLNKSDIYADINELEEVVMFVKDNAQRLLGVEEATVYPVSARKAFKAKSESNVSDGSLDPDRLTRNSTWTSSGFDKLERFISDFLGGSSDAGAERRRLKLTTPLGIALALLEACERQLAAEAEKAELDLDVLTGLLKRLQLTQKSLENDASLRRQGILAVISAAKGRAEKLVDSVLRLSNVDAMARYLLGGDRTGTMPVSDSYDKLIIGSAYMDVQRLLEEYQGWMKDTLAQQVSSYKEVVTNRWPNKKLIKNEEMLLGGWDLSQNESTQKQGSIAVLDGFDTQAAKILLEQEMREVVLTTFGGLGAAGVSASVLTSVLPNTIEDLVALAVCSAGGLVGVWNLPSRRADVKRKVQKVADSFASQLGAAMLTEQKEAIAQLKQEVDEVIEPYLQAAQDEANRVNELKKRVQQTIDQIEALRLRVQNLGIS